MKAYSLDLRQRVVSAYEAGETTIQEVAGRFSVGATFVKKMLGKNAALVTGKFVISGAGKPDRTGWFTSVWEKTKKGWRMIHDHS